jgi:hypothetical protein
MCEWPLAKQFWIELLFSFAKIPNVETATTSVLRLGRIEPIELCEISIAAVNIFELELSNVSRQFVECNILLLVSIRLVAMQRVIERAYQFVFGSRVLTNTLISLHCKQIECGVSLVVQYTNAPCQPYSFGQLNFFYINNILFNWHYIFTKKTADRASTNVGRTQLTYTHWAT